MGAMQEGGLEDALRGKRRIASYATDSDYAPFARAMLWKLGYALQPPEELEHAELRIVREDRLAEVASLPPLPLILLTNRRQAENGDARVTGTVRRPAGVHPLYRLLQAALEEHPRGVPRVAVSLPARGIGGDQIFELAVPSISENGCLLAGAKLPALDSHMELRIDLPWGEKIEVAALISYEQGGNAGAVFQAMTPDAQRRIAKLVTRLLQQS
jgi:hypothetical protein